MTDSDTMFQIFAACVPIILAAMGYQFQVIRAMQKQLDACIDKLRNDK